MDKDSYNKLLDYFREKKIIVAFSGGLDSTLLLETARVSAKSVLPVIVKSSLVPAKEIKFAIDYLTERKIRYKIVSVNPLNHPKIIENNPQRCYFCKTLIFESIIKETKELECDFIVEGSNISDLSDYRPGMKAIKELNIKSPYLELGIDKNQIRAIAEKLKLNIAKKPATTCLATRIPYGKELSELKLEKIEKAEGLIQNIFNVKTLRLRAHDDIARIEVLLDDIEQFFDDEKREKLIIELKKLGFNYITIDLEGYRQGSMNVPLPIEVKENEESINIRS